MKRSVQVWDGTDLNRPPSFYLVYFLRRCENVLRVFSGIHHHGNPAVNNYDDDYSR